MRWHAVGLVVGLLSLGCDDSPTSPTAPLSSIRIAPDVPFLVSGARQTFQALGTRAAGSEAPLTASWTADDPAVLSVDGAGIVTARAPGTATLFATAEGRIGSRVIRIIGNAAGTFEGTWTLTSCDSNDFRTCSRCCAIGTLGRMQFVAEQEADRVRAGMTWTWTTPPVFTPVERTLHVDAAAGAFTSTGLLSLGGAIDAAQQLIVWEARMSEDGRSMHGRFTYASAAANGFSTFGLSGTFTLTRRQP